MTKTYPLRLSKEQLDALLDVVDGRIEDDTTGDLHHVETARAVLMDASRHAYAATIASGGSGDVFTVVTSIMINEDGSVAVCCLQEDGDTEDTKAASIEGAIEAFSDLPMPLDKEQATRIITHIDYIHKPSRQESVVETTHDAEIAGEVTTVETAIK